MSRSSRRSLAAVLAAAAATTLALVGGAVPASAAATVDRLSGPDRFATSAAVSARTADPGEQRVYVASGRGFADALSGAPAAAADGSPVLLVDTHVVPDAVRAELGRIQPEEVVVLGGPSVVSDAVATALSEHGTVTRLSGPDRFATSAAVSAAAFEPGVPVAYVASGRGYPDALAGAPAAGSQGGPVLLVDTHSVPAAVADELERLRPGRIVILGGTTVVAPTAEAQLRDLTAGSVTRLAGADRYATSAAISRAAFPSASTVYLASGRDFPDALSGAPAAGAQRAPVLLVTPTGIPAPVREELVRLAPERVIILGGPAAIGQDVARAAADPSAPTTSPAAAAALAALDSIKVTTTLAGGYDRDLFGNEWIDEDGDELDTRNEILVRDLTGEVLEDRGSETVVLSGVLNDPYTGKTINFVRGVGTSNAVQIDHIVAVSAAWQLGANTWTTERRVKFYNDFDNLLAVDGPTNSSKSDSTLGEWQPPNTAFHCDYAIEYVEVIDEYDLAMKPVDVTYARELLPTC